VGTLLLEPVSEMLRAFAGLRIVFYAMIIVLFIIFWSEGILNWAIRKYEQFEIQVRV
jgi:branched-chain amino acid transport system permease protein